MMFLLVVLGFSFAVSAATVTVTVGEGQQPAYSPNRLVAARGDIVSFRFVGGTHTVSQSGGVNVPCVPLNAGFDSGITIASNATQVWEIVIDDDTKPIWFYCKQAGHCKAGMAGVINAADGLIENYIANAKSFDAFPQVPQLSLKGVGASAERAPVPADDGQGAPQLGVTTPSATPTRSTSSSPPSAPLSAPSNPRSSNLAASRAGPSTKLIVAIVVPVVSSILALSSLFILLRRRRRRRHRAQQPQQQGVIPYSVHTNREEAAPQISKLDLAPGRQKSEPGSPEAVSELRELHSAMQRAGLSVQTLLSSLRAPQDALSEGSPPQYEA